MYTVSHKETMTRSLGVLRQKKFHTPGSTLSGVGGCGRRGGFPRLFLKIDVKHETQTHIRSLPSKDDCTSILGITMVWGRVVACTCIFFNIKQF